jgi:hypothetical protein
MWDQVLEFNKKMSVCFVHPIRDFRNYYAPLVSNGIDFLVIWCKINI